MAAECCAIRVLARVGDITEIVHGKSSILPGLSNASNKAIGSACTQLGTSTMAIRQPSRRTIHCSAPSVPITGVRSSPPRGRYARAISRTRVAATRPRAYSTKTSMNSKFELVASATSETQMRFRPVLSGPLPGVAPAVEVAAMFQLGASVADTPQLTRWSVC